MAEKKVTILDIANKLKLSKSTVSKALSSATDVNEQTRERVLRCASELGYYVKQDRTPKEKNVIIFIYGIHYGSVDQFGYEIILGIQAAANDANCGVKIAAINDDELRTGKYYSIMAGRSYYGSFFLGFRPHEEFIEHVKKTNLPIVVLDNYFDSPLVARVGCDSMVGIKQIVEHLIKKGHSHIGFLGGERDSVVTKEREEAFRKVLLENDIIPDDNIIKYGHFSGKNMKETVLEIAAKNPTAIVCVSDIIACSAIKILNENSYLVPDDISVTGYDNLPLAQYSHPALTTVSQNRIHIGKTAFSILQLMKNGIRLESVSLRPELVERESVKDLTKN